MTHITGNTRDSHGDHCVCETRTQRVANRDGEQQAREGELSVDVTAEDLVGAGVSCYQPESNPEARADEHRDDGDWRDGAGCVWNCE